MDEYYELRYKSSPKKVSYILHKSSDNLEIVGSSLSPKKMGIKVDEKGIISVPKYFFPLKKINKSLAFEILTNKNIAKIEKLVGDF